MSARKADDTPQFHINSTVVFQLGRELISDEIQALSELVKNSYDADATYAKITIDTEAEYEGIGQGSILIEDDGFGMTQNDIRRGWLTISGDTKRALKAQGWETPRGRVPLGDKGLGRLATQRLGNHVEIITRPCPWPRHHRDADETEYEQQHKVSFSWSDFTAGRTLADVPVKQDASVAQRDHGTSLRIVGLTKVDAWRGDEAVKRIRRELSRIIAPYAEVRTFTIVAAIDGVVLDLAEIGDRVREAADVHYELDFDGDELSITGRVKLAFLMPARGARKDLALLHIHQDRGVGLWEYLAGQNARQKYRMRRLRSGKWYLECRESMALSALVGVQVSQEGAPQSPGPFRAEIDSFDFATQQTDEQSALDSKSELRKLVDYLSGVGIYRDGFRVRIDHDWLELGKRWTTATSWYGLKPENVMGYVSLSARHNRQLQEMTNREGFSDTPHYRNFALLFQQFINYTGRVHQFLRRSANDYLDARAGDAEAPGTRNASRLQTGLRQSLATVEGNLRRLREASDHIAPLLATLEEHASAMPVPDGRRANGTDVDTTDALRRAREQSEELTTMLQSAMDELSRTRSDLDGLSQAIGQLDLRIEDLEGRLGDFYEAAGLGLTAEALSHELSTVVDRLVADTSKLAESMKRAQAPDKLRVLTYLETVRGALDGVRKQLAHLAPSLKYVRERRTDLAIKERLREWADYHRERLAGKRLPVSIDLQVTRDFTVRMNLGKFIQVMDNLLLNSEYWLREHLRRKRVSEGHIRVECDKPFIRFWDDGPGVDPAVEETLFEPFVTMKPRGEGRGLGLFIIGQLLETDGCTIRLCDDRNDDGRRYVFELDLTGALSDD